MCVLNDLFKPVQLCSALYRPFFKTSRQLPFLIRIPQLTLPADVHTHHTCICGHTGEYIQVLRDPDSSTGEQNGNYSVFHLIEKIIPVDHSVSKCVDLSWNVTRTCCCVEYGCLPEGSVTTIFRENGIVGYGEYKEMQVCHTRSRICWCDWMQ